MRSGGTHDAVIVSNTQGRLSPLDLAERAVHRRAVEASWGMPAVNLELMLQARSRRAPTQPDGLLVAAPETGRTRRSRRTPT